VVHSPAGPVFTDFHRKEKEVTFLSFSPFLATTPRRQERAWGFFVFGFFSFPPFLTSDFYLFVPCLGKGGGGRVAPPAGPCLTDVTESIMISFHGQDSKAPRKAPVFWAFLMCFSFFFFLLLEAWAGESAFAFATTPGPPQKKPPGPLLFNLCHRKRRCSPMTKGSQKKKKKASCFLGVPYFSCLLFGRSLASFFFAFCTQRRPPCSTMSRAGRNNARQPTTRAGGNNSYLPETLGSGCAFVPSLPMATAFPTPSVHITVLLKKPPTPTKDRQAQCAGGCSNHSNKPQRAVHTPTINHQRGSGSGLDIVRSFLFPSPTTILRAHSTTCTSPLLEVRPPGLIKERQTASSR